MMSFQEKYEEYKQRKEAQAFFNQNNDQKVYGNRKEREPCPVYYRCRK